MKKYYIFDFDGTLVNTFHDSVLAYNEALKQYGQKEFEYTSLDMVDYQDFTENMTEDMNILETYFEIYRNSPKENTKPYEGVPEILSTLIKQGKEVAICSNREEGQLKEFTNKFFPEINFKYVVGYRKGGLSKPDAKFTSQVLENEDYSNEEIVYIGDKVKDIQTAKNVGIDAIIVTWGQGNEEAYSDEYPIAVIDDIRELLKY